MRQSLTLHLEHMRPTEPTQTLAVPYSKLCLLFLHCTRGGGIPIPFCLRTAHCTRSELSQRGEDLRRRSMNPFSPRSPNAVRDARCPAHILVLFYYYHEYACMRAGALKIGHKELLVTRSWYSMSPCCNSALGLCYPSPLLLLASGTTLHCSSDCSLLSLFLARSSPALGHRVPLRRLPRIPPPPSVISCVVATSSSI